MLVREGISANHKHVYRLYREEGLAMRIRRRRRIQWTSAVPKPTANRPNERWSIDFVSDCVSTGRVIRMLTVVDECENVLRLKSILRWVDYACAGCWSGSSANEACQRRSC